MLNPINLTKSNNTNMKPNRTIEISILNAELSKFGLKVNRIVEGVSVVKFQVRIYPDTPIKKVKNLEYGVALNKPNVTVKQNENNPAILEISMPQEERKTFTMGDLYSPQFVNNGRNKLLMMIGKEQDGGKVYKDLASSPHMMVSGITGSGKSVFLHQVICSLLMNHNDDVEYYGIDTKRTELNQYEALNNFHYIDEAWEANRVLAGLCQEMDRRYEVLHNAGVRDISNYNGNMKRIVVIIDEYADLTTDDLKKPVNASVLRLAQKARACGIHLIIATQHPKSNIIATEIKDNFPVRVALKVYDHNQSKVAINKTGAENLLGQGDMLFDPHNPKKPGLMRIQAAKVETSDIQYIVNLAIQQQQQRVEREKKEGFWGKVRRKANEFFNQNEAYC